jgi:hypothetical protein
MTGGGGQDYSNPGIFDSTTIPHTTVNATGNGQGGFYKVNLTAGTVITIDIDGIADPDVHDSWRRPLDSNSNKVDENDDGGRWASRRAFDRYSRRSHVRGRRGYSGWSS